MEMVGDHLLYVVGRELPDHAFVYIKLQTLSAYNVLDTWLFVIRRTTSQSLLFTTFRIGSRCILELLGTLKGTHHDIIKLLIDVLKVGNIQSIVLEFLQSNFCVFLVLYIEFENILLW